MYRYQDPADDADAYYGDLAKEAMDHQIVENEMHYHRQAALAKLKRIVHPKYVDKISRMLSFCHKEEMKEADEIVNELNISDKEFAGINQDFYMMESLLDHEAYENKMENDLLAQGWL
jgi:hypothetical protein